MGILDDYKSVKNRTLIFQASIKMIKDKYGISVNDVILSKIADNVISVISNDAILLNTPIKLNELNNLTLTKIKEYIGKQIKTDDVHEQREQRDQIEQGEKGEQVPTNENDMGVPKLSIKLSDDNELLNRMKTLEEKRRLSSIVGEQNLLKLEENTPQLANTIAVADVPEVQPIVLPTITEHIYKAVTDKGKNKKTFIIGSYDRDWVNQPVRNVLQFNIGLDLQTNVVEPLKILFPKFVKELTPYVNMVITDGIRVQKYNYIFYKNNGDWDEWTLISEHIEKEIDLTRNNWKISFYDFLHKELQLGNDDIKIAEVSKYVDTDNSYDCDVFACKIMLEKKHYAYYEYDLQSIRKYDDILLKTYSNDIVRVKVIENNISTIMLSKDGLKAEDFINSKLLNCKSQYVMMFSYYAKDESNQ